jgi:hypothetical protein
MKKLLVFIGCLALVSLVNCNKSKYTLTLALDNSSGNGYTAYSKLVTEGGDENSTAEYSGKAIFSGNYAAIIIEDIEEATYTLYTFIDDNNHITDPNNPKPDTGDPYNSQTIIMEDDITLPISSWTDH